MKSKFSSKQSLFLLLLLVNASLAWGQANVTGGEAVRTFERRTTTSTSSSGPVSSVSISQGQTSVDPTVVKSCDGSVKGSTEIPAGIIRSMFANMSEAPSIEYTLGGNVKIILPPMINRCNHLFEVTAFKVDANPKKYLSLNFTLNNDQTFESFTNCLKEIKVGMTAFYVEGRTGEGDKQDISGMGIVRKGIIEPGKLPDSDFSSSKSVEVSPADAEGREIVFGSRGPAYPAFNKKRNENQVFASDCFYLEKASPTPLKVSRTDLIAKDYRKRLEDTMADSVDSADCARRINEMLRQLVDSGSSTTGPVTQVIEQFEKVRDQLYGNRIRELADQLESASNESSESDKPESAFEGIGNEESLQLLTDYMEDVLNPSIDRLQKLYNEYKGAKSRGEREKTKKLLEEIRKLTRKIKSYVSPFDSGDSELDYDDQDQVVDSTLLDSLRLAGKFKLADKIAEIIALGKFATLLNDDGSDHAALKTFEQVKSKVVLLKKKSSELNRLASTNYTKMKKRERLITQIKKGKTKGISERLYSYASEANYQASRAVKSARNDIQRDYKQASKKCDYFFWTDSRMKKCQRAQVKHERFSSWRMNIAQRQSESYRTKGQAYRARGETVRSWELEGERYLSEKTRKRNGGSWDPFFDLENDSVFTGGRDFTFRNGYESYNNGYDFDDEGEDYLGPQYGSSQPFFDSGSRGIGSDPRVGNQFQQFPQQQFPQQQQQQFPQQQFPQQQMNPLLSGQQNPAAQQYFQQNPFAAQPQYPTQQPMVNNPQNYSLFPSR